MAVAVTVAWHVAGLLYRQGHGGGCPISAMEKVKFWKARSVEQGRLLEETFSGLSSGGPVEVNQAGALNPGGDMGRGRKDRESLRSSAEF